MNKVILKYVYIKIFVIFSFGNLYAVGLLDAVKLALNNNNEYKANIETFNSEYANKKLAKSFILPQINLAANITNNRPEIGSSEIYNTLSLTISQPLFDYSLWSYYNIAKLTAQRAEIQLAKDTNNIILQTVEQYLNFLTAIDLIEFEEAQSKSLKEQMDDIKKRIEVGQVRAVDIEEVKASYEYSQYQLQVAKNNFQIEKNKLEKMIGSKVISYTKVIDNLSENILSLENNIEDWIISSKEGNLDILFLKINLLMSEENIQVNTASFYPNVSFVGSFNYNNRDSVSVASGNTSQSLGINVNMNLYSGGSDKIERNQLESNKKALEYSLKQLESDIENYTREYYLSISSGIVELKSLEQSLISSKKSLEAMKSSYAVGLRTNTDVLIATQNYFDAKKDYSSAKNKFLLNILGLQAVVGSLKISDIVIINKYLN